MEALSCCAVGDGKGAGGACPAAYLGGADIVYRARGSARGAVNGICADSLLAQILCREAAVVTDDGANGIGGFLNPGVVVHKPNFVNVLQNIPAARPALGQDDRVPGPKVMPHPVQVRETPVARQDEENLSRCPWR